MKIYLGNSQDVVIDVDEIIVHPIAYSCGGVYDIKDKNAWVAKCWTGITQTLKYFYYETSKYRSDCYTYDDAMEAAQKHHDKHSTNTKASQIVVPVDEIDASVMTRFRYVQPLIEYEAQDVPIDPTFLGLWLGDGTSVNTSITNIDPAIIQYIHDHATSIGMSVTRVKDTISYHTVKANMVKGGKNLIIEKFKELNLLKNKHIPEVYMKNSVQVRVKVLSGLIDTDGFLSKNVYEIVQKNHQLAQDIVDLARSLGFFSKMVDKIGYATNTVNKTKRVYKRVYIYPDYHTPKLELLVDYKVLSQDPVFTGIPFSLEKTKETHMHKWTDEMLAKFDETVAKYTVKGRVSWTKMVVEEPIYAHVSSNTLRQYYAVKRKAAGASTADS